MTGQLWQAARFQCLDEMVGNADALASLRAIESGFVLIEGPIGCGKTSTALAWVKERTGRTLEEQQTISCLGKYHLQHIHAAHFDLDEAIHRKMFFYTATTTIIVCDEAQELQLKRQQSKLKTIPPRPEFTLVLVTSNPELIEPSIRDRCARIRLGPLSARELKPMVERACNFRGISFNAAILPALNRANVFRPRAILNVVDAVARGIPVEQAVVGQ